MTGEPNELDALELEAAAVDAQIAPVVTDLNPPPVQEAAPIVDRLAEAKGLIGMLRPLVTMAFPCIKDAPDNEWDALHQPVADCLTFYNVDVSKYLANPLAALAFAAVPLVMRGVANWKPEPDKKTADKTLAGTVVADPAASNESSFVPRA